MQSLFYIIAINYPSIFFIPVPSMTRSSPITSTNRLNNSSNLFQFSSALRSWTKESVQNFPRKSIGFPSQSVVSSVRLGSSNLWFCPFAYAYVLSSFFDPRCYLPERPWVVDKRVCPKFAQKVHRRHFTICGTQIRSYLELTKKSISGLKIGSDPGPFL